MKKDHFEFLLEDVNDKFDLILEMVTALLPLRGQVQAIDDRLAGVESDVKIIKRVVKEHSRELRDHDLAIHRLSQSMGL
jgi:hypothetical protein